MTSDEELKKMLADYYAQGCTTMLEMELAKELLEARATINKQREVNALYQGEVQRLQNQVEFYKNEDK